MKEEGLIFSNSNVPLVRAGFANFIFFILIIGSIVFYNVFKDLGINIYIRLIIIFCFWLFLMKIYINSISRIFVKNRVSLVIMGPLSVSEICVNKIIETKLYGIPSSMMIVLKIRMKFSRYSRFYFVFAAVQTKYGGYMDTKTKLLSLLNELQCH